MLDMHTCYRPTQLSLRCQGSQRSPALSRHALFSGSSNSSHASRIIAATVAVLALQVSKGQAQGPRQQQHSQQLKQVTNDGFDSNAISSRSSSGSSGGCARKRSAGAIAAAISEHPNCSTIKKLKHSNLGSVANVADGANVAASAGEKQQTAAASQPHPQQSSGHPTASTERVEQVGSGTGLSSSSSKQGQRKASSSKRRPLSWRSLGKAGDEFAAASGNVTSAPVQQQQQQPQQQRSGGVRQPLNRAASAAVDGTADAGGLPSQSSSRGRFSRHRHSSRQHSSNSKVNSSIDGLAAISATDGRQAADGSSSSSSSMQQANSIRPLAAGSNTAGREKHQQQQQQRPVRVLTASVQPHTNSSSSSSSSTQGSWYKCVQQQTRLYGRASSHPPAAADPALRDIKLRDFSELRGLVQQYGAAADLTTLLAMFSRLRTVPWHDAHDKAAVLDQLWELLKPHLQLQQQQQLRELPEGQQQPHRQQEKQQQHQQRVAGSPRHCAEAMLAASKLQHAPAGLYETCLAAFAAKVATADPRVLANAIYAVATAPSGAVRDSCKQDVEQVLLPAFVRVAKTAAPQAVSNVAYAVALLGCRGVLLQQLLTAVPSSTWQEASTQEMSNTVWAAGVLGQQLPTAQLQVLLTSFMQKLPQAKPQHISNCIWAVASLGQRMPHAQLQQLVAAVVEARHGSSARTAAVALWSAAKMGVQLQQQQVDALVEQVVPASSGEQGSDCNPQAVSNTLWAVATMRQSLSTEQLQRLLTSHLQQLPLPDSNPQCISNTLWALATLKAHVETDALEAIFNTFAARLQSAEPQALSNALWAASSLHPPFLPSQLLQDESAVKLIVEVLLPGMKVQELSNVIVACGLLGWDDAALLLPLVSRAAELAEGERQSQRQQQQHLGQQGDRDSLELQQSSTSTTALPDVPSSSHSSSSRAALNTQAWCNICWAAAVLNLTELTPLVLGLAAQGISAWRCLGVEDQVQLFQLHMWLADCGSDGLAGMLNQQQLEECRGAWIKLLEQRTQTSRLQENVYKEVQQVPWLQDAVLEWRTADGLFSADIAATVVLPQKQQQQQQQQQQQRRVVMEVDGPWHFRRPDHALTGATRFRNRALAARGYVVVSLPWWEWRSMSSSQDKVKWIEGRVQAALVQPAAAAEAEHEVACIPAILRKSKPVAAADCC